MLFRGLHWASERILFIELTYSTTFFLFLFSMRFVVGLLAARPLSTRELLRVIRTQRALRHTFVYYQWQLWSESNGFSALSLFLSLSLLLSIHCISVVVWAQLRECQLVISLSIGNKTRTEKSKYSNSHKKSRNQPQNIRNA